jgi:hypothetical protein
MDLQAFLAEALDDGGADAGGGPCHEGGLVVGEGHGDHFLSVEGRPVAPWSKALSGRVEFTVSTARPARQDGLAVER